MIKALIKLAFVGLLANAAWQFITVYWAHIKFSDAVELTTQFRGDKTDDQIRERIVELAGEFDVPVSDENLLIQVVNNHTLVDSSYSRRIAFVPGVSYPWPFIVHTDTVKASAPGLASPK